MINSAFQIPNFDAIFGIESPGRKYPPYNIRKVDENHYVIEMAVAGFSKSEIDIELKNDTLIVKGNVNEVTDDTEYLYRGIASRYFTRTFTLADTVEVKNAEMLNGMLKIWLERLVESPLVKKIPINEPQVSTYAPEFLAEEAKQNV